MLFPGAAGRFNAVLWFNYSTGPVTYRQRMPILYIARVKIMQNTKLLHVELEDIKINVKIKLAVLWSTFMFLYIYVDYFHLFMPNSLEDMLAGKIFLFDINQAFLLVGLASVTIPALMIFLSIALAANINRWANIIAATLYIPYTLFNLAGEAWMHMVFGAFIEITLLLIIIFHAWKWPHIVR